MLTGKMPAPRPDHGGTRPYLWLCPPGAVNNAVSEGQRHFPLYRSCCVTQMRDFFSDVLMFFPDFTHKMKTFHNRGIVDTL